MPNPICVKCEVAYVPYKNGVYVKELKCDDKEFYKLWSSDMWICPVCGHKIMHGFGQKPLVYDYQIKTSPEHKKMVERAEEEGVVLWKEKKHEEVC